ncbi:hypothetical protein B0T13DRAFT_450926 [Neurospora crassa]|nr:hypothetical protein B0T13DRAFT_450926 [Neurospora crassa]
MMRELSPRRPTKNSFKVSPSLEAFAMLSSTGRGDRTEGDVYGQRRQSGDRLCSPVVLCRWRLPAHSRSLNDDGTGEVLLCSRMPVTAAGSMEDESRSSSSLSSSKRLLCGLALCSELVKGLKAMCLWKAETSSNDDNGLRRRFVYRLFGRTRTHREGEVGSGVTCWVKLIHDRKMGQ